MSRPTKEIANVYVPDRTGATDETPYLDHAEWMGMSLDAEPPAATLFAQAAHPCRLDLVREHHGPIPETDGFETLARDFGRALTDEHGFQLRAVTIRVRNRRAQHIGRLVIVNGDHEGAEWLHY